jgi:hypothetical protein
MNKVSDFLNNSLGVYDVRGLEVEPTYWQAGIILVLVFLLVFTIARMRYLYVHWSMGRSAWAMLFWGFILALIVEGFLIFSGRTLFTEVLGWESAPKPISTLLTISRSKLVDVLGVSEQIPSYETVVEDYKELPENEMNEVQSIICEPQ